MSPKAQQDPVWELSSFSEAAMASAQPTSMLPDPPLSQPRRGSTAPTFDLHALSRTQQPRKHLDPHATGAGVSPNPVWELSSFSEAAMASVQPTSMLPDPPLSQPRRGSTAPTFDLHALNRTQQPRTHLDPHAPGAGVSPNPVWELSSFSEAAMASALPTSLSQPRRSSTAPTFNLHALSECAVGMTMEKRTDED